MVHGGSLNLSPSSGCEHDPATLRQRGVAHTGLQPCSVGCEPVSTLAAKQMSGLDGAWVGDNPQVGGRGGDLIAQQQAASRAQTTCLSGLHSGGLVLTQGAVSERTTCRA